MWAFVVRFFHLLCGFAILQSKRLGAKQNTIAGEKDAYIPNEASEYERLNINGITAKAVGSRDRRKSMACHATCTALEHMHYL